MKNNKKACCGAATPKQAEAEQVKRANLQKHDTTYMTKNPVYDILPEGKKNAISPKDLANVLGLASERALRAEIEYERENGAIILSDSYGGGYYRSDRVEDVKECYAIMWARTRTTLKSIRPMRQWLRERGEISG